MSDQSASTRLLITADTCPRLPRHIKLRHDGGRGRWVLLAPERVFDPDDTAVEVLKLCDGQISVEGIADRLAHEYHAPADEIRGDIIALLQDLADKGVVTS